MQQETGLQLIPTYSYARLYKKGDINTYLRENLYREKTNVFAYYILCGLFMNNFYKFMMWCHKNNLSLFKYHKTQKNIYNFKDLIESLYKDSSLNESSECPDFKSNKLLIQTTRMSVVEFT